MDEQTIEITSVIARFPGRVTLPAHDYVTGEQYNDIRMAHERRGKLKADLAHTPSQKMAYIGIEFVEKHGLWEFDGVDIETFKAWDTAPEAEPIRFVTWFGNVFSEYVNELLDPKG